MTDTANTTTETAPINYAKPTVFKIGGKWAAGLGYEVLRTRTKAEAEAHITVADALCCGVRAAVQERYSYLDFAMMSAADDLGYAARKLRDELARIQRDRHRRHHPHGRRVQPVGGGQLRPPGRRRGRLPRGVEGGVEALQHARRGGAPRRAHRVRRHRARHRRLHQRPGGALVRATYHFPGNRGAVAWPVCEDCRKAVPLADIRACQAEGGSKYILPRCCAQCADVPRQADLACNCAGCNAGSLPWADFCSACNAAGCDGGPCDAWVALRAVHAEGGRGTEVEIEGRRILRESMLRQVKPGMVLAACPCAAWFFREYPEPGPGRMADAGWQVWSADGHLLFCGPYAEAEAYRRNRNLSPLLVVAAPPVRK